MVTINVKHGQRGESIFRAFCKLVEKSNKLTELRYRKHHTKPTTIRKEHNTAVTKRRLKLRKRNEAQRITMLKSMNVAIPFSPETKED